ncbi:mechanosensitive ion channel family protein [Trueperella sp. LYQ143]|uniref:mechanosensitive ion channel family protein n=1 Tax=unclassified Trueperella TaxID=2630174 RepID=UPI00398385E2
MHACIWALSSAFLASPSPDSTDTPGDISAPVGEAVAATFDVLALAMAVAIGVGIGILVGFIVVGILRAVGRRHHYVDPVARSVSRRLEILLLIIGGWMGLIHGRRAILPGLEPAWVAVLDQIFLIVVILAVTWCVVGLANGLIEAINLRMAEASEGRAARVKTQTQILRRVLVCVLWLLGIAGVLLTFPAARAAGASIFASAGIISVVAGLAAQTTLGNVFAGLQLAFTDSIRVGDIVMYETHYTTVEEITLTYVVLAVWDGRRIIVPSTIMTTKSFENWTRRAPQMTGDVTWEVDWAVPIDAARMQLEHILHSTDLWDGRTGVMQVSDATRNSSLTLRAIISAKDSPTLTDLKNYVREEFVKWIQYEATYAMPHIRKIDDDMQPVVELNEATLAQVSARLEDRPPTFMPAAVAHDEARDTRETEVISAEAVEQLLRIPVRERAAQLAQQGVTGPMVSHPTVITDGHKSALFTGSPEADKLAEKYAGPGRAAYEERQRTLERNLHPQMRSQRQYPEEIHEPEKTASNDSGNTPVSENPIHLGGERAEYLSDQSDNDEYVAAERAMRHSASKVVGNSALGAPVAGEAAVETPETADNSVRGNPAAGSSTASDSPERGKNG